MKKPDIDFLGDTYRFTWPTEIAIAMERLRENREGDLVGEIIVKDLSAPYSTAEPGLLHFAKFNCSSTPARSQLVKSLDGAKEHNWAAALEYVCHQAVEHWRAGDPIQDLWEVPDRCTRWCVEPFVERGGPAILFSNGGLGKSLMGLAIAISYASGVGILGPDPEPSGAALYLDWEADAATHAERMRAICAGHELTDFKPPIFYRRQTASLAESAPHLKGLIAENGIKFMVVDSMALARGGEPESADTTTRLFNAARSLGVDWLGIDHVAKNATDPTTPFGSIFTHNTARRTWGLERAEVQDDGEQTIVLTNHKVNNGKPLPKMAFTVRFEERPDGGLRTVHYRNTDVRDIASMFKRLKQHEQIQKILVQHGALVIEGIRTKLQQEQIEYTHTSIKAVLNRFEGRLFVKLDESREPRWGLLSDRKESA